MALFLFEDRLLKYILYVEHYVMDRNLVACALFDVL